MTFVPLHHVRKGTRLSPSLLFIRRRMGGELGNEGYVLSVGRGRRESILYAGAEPATRLLGRQHSDPSLQANEPSQLPAKTTFKFNI